MEGRKKVYPALSKCCVWQLYRDLWNLCQRTGNGITLHSQQKHTFQFNKLWNILSSSTLSAYNDKLQSLSQEELSQQTGQMACLNCLKWIVCRGFEVSFRSRLLLRSAYSDFKMTLVWHHRSKWVTQKSHQGKEWRHPWLQTNVFLPGL